MKKGSIKPLHKIERQELAYPIVIQLLTSQQPALLAAPISSTELSLYEMANDFRAIKSFSLPDNFSAIEVAPGGNYLALRAESSLKLIAPDGTIKAAAEFSESERYQESIAFSSCGKFLWFAGSVAEEARLWLLDASNLEIIDVYSDHQYPWYEVNLAFQSSANVLAANNNCDDNIIELAFYSEQAGKIVKHPNNVSADNGGEEFPEDGLNFHGISPDKTIFTAIDYFSFLWVWNWPDCTLRGSIYIDDTSPEPDIGKRYHGGVCGYFDNLILTGLENENHDLTAIRLISAKSLKPVGDIELPCVINNGTIDIFNNGLMVAYDDNPTLHIWQYLPMVELLEKELSNNSAEQ